MPAARGLRDPDLGVVVEVLQEGETTPGGIRPRHYALAPAIVSATLSVADLGRARAFFTDVIGLAPEPIELHPPGLERIRGLDGVRREALSCAAATSSWRSCATTRRRGARGPRTRGSATRASWTSQWATASASAPTCC